MNLGNITEDVAQHLLPFFSQNEVLRIRRVSRLFRGYANRHLELWFTNNRINYIGLDPDHIVINHEEGPWIHYRLTSMAKFLDLDLPIKPTRFSFEFEFMDHHMFTNVDWMLPRFLEVHGINVTHLHLFDLTLPLEGDKEEIFFAVLSVSLRHLSVEFLYFREDAVRKEPEIPVLFSTLTSLEINRVNLDPGDEMEELYYFWNIVRACTMLESLLYPNYLHDENFIRTGEFFNLDYQSVGRLLEQDHLSALKTYNLKNLDWINTENAGIGTFARFCTQLYEKNVKLKEIDAMSFRGVDDLQQLQIIGQSIFSMTEYSITHVDVPFPFLEKIDMITSECDARPFPPGMNYITPEWPALKEMLLCIDGRLLRSGHQNETLYNVLFRGIQRPSIHSLTVIYRDEVCWEADEDEENFNLDVHFPNIELVTQCCQNLTSLTIKNWMQSELEMAHLWPNLPHLQCLTLDSCTTIGFLSFAGEDEEHIAFNRLKNLGKLRLLQVHIMSNLTDFVFKMIFRRLRLTEFILESYMVPFVDDTMEVFSFTQAGIISLLESPFAQTIETFPFNCWRLAGYDLDGMLSLGAKFRSVNRM